MIEPVIKKREDGRDVYFSVYWSKFRKAEKYDIVTVVPSVGGIYELYYMDDKKKLNLMFVDWVWYGGLRSRLRKITDPVLIYEPEHRKILEQYDCYYRYSMSSSSMDMKDVIFFFGKTHFPDRDFDHSGRYDNIFLTEHSPEKIVTI